MDQRVDCEKLPDNSLLLSKACIPRALLTPLLACARAKQYSTLILRHRCEPRARANDSVIQLAHATMWGQPAQSWRHRAMQARASPPRWGSTTVTTLGLDWNSSRSYLSAFTASANCFTRSTIRGPHRDEISSSSSITALFFTAAIEDQPGRAATVAAV